MQAGFRTPVFESGGRSARGRAGLFGAIRTALGCAAAIFTLVLLARGAMHEAAEPALKGPVRRAALVAPAAVWQPIPKAKPHYAVAVPELRSLPQAHEARRHADGGREDKLVYGIFESEQAYLRLALLRGARDAERPASFFLDLARRAGEAGLAVVRSGRTALVATKLGPLETAEVALSDSVERSCLAFRLQHNEVGLVAQGWYCPAAAAEARLDPACLIDLVAILPEANDQALQVLFAQAERRRSPACGAMLEATRRTS